MNYNTQRGTCSTLTLGNLILDAPATNESVFKTGRKKHLDLNRHYFNFLRSGLWRARGKVFFTTGKCFFTTATAVNVDSSQTSADRSQKNTWRWDALILELGRRPLGCREAKCFLRPMGPKCFLRPVVKTGSYIHDSLRISYITSTPP